jgi:hypothetical protein
LIKSFFTLILYDFLSIVSRRFKMSAKIRWARNAQLARYAGVSVMTVWRWKQLPGFPPAAIVNGIEYRDLVAFDSWMSGFIARRDTEPTRGQRAVKNLSRDAGAPQRLPTTASGSKSGAK